MTSRDIPAPAECAERAADCIRNYAGNRRLDGAFSELLTDMAHLAADEGWDFEAEARCALRNVTDERKAA